MTTYVRVDDDHDGRMGLKFVLTPDGHSLKLLPGQNADPGPEVVRHVREARFHVRMSTPVVADAEAPDALALALRRVADRLFGVMPDRNAGVRAAALRHPRRMIAALGVTPALVDRWTE